MADAVSIASAPRLGLCLVFPLRSRLRQCLCLAVFQVPLPLYLQSALGWSRPATGGPTINANASLPLPPCPCHSSLLLLSSPPFAPLSACLCLSSCFYPSRLRETVITKPSCWKRCWRCTSSGTGSARPTPRHSSDRSGTGTRPVGPSAAHFPLPNNRLARWV